RGLDGPEHGIAAAVGHGAESAAPRGPSVPGPTRRPGRSGRVTEAVEDGDVGVLDGRAAGGADDGFGIRSRDPAAAAGPDVRGRLVRAVLELRGGLGRHAHGWHHREDSQAAGYDDVVNYKSTAYATGVTVGQIHTTLLQAAAGGAGGLVGYAARGIQLTQE